jgi:hypothetical protein
MSKTFCPIPWIFQAARANGDIRVCCQANVTKNKGVIRKSDGSAYNAGKDNIEDSRNADLMKIMRLNMLAGVWSEECGRCRQEEENGLVSRRSYENEQWDYSFKQAQQETLVNGAIDINKTPVRYYDLRFGNFCNLKCRMCGPTDSDSWYEDWIKLTGTTKYHDTSGIVNIKEVKGKLVTGEYDWPSYEPFWQSLESNAKNIEHVYFAGGEPMLIERHYDFLEKCVEQGVSKNITIEYNTNMSTIPTRVLNLWKKFKQVRIGASVDGMGAVLEYQRHPAKWEKVLKNLKEVDNLPDNVISWLAFTVTVYNVNHMIDFMKWKLEESGFKKINSSNRRPIITYHVAHHPKKLNIRVLPDEYKKELTEKFNNFLIWVEDKNFNYHIKKHAKDIVNGITTYMNSQSYYNEHWQEFLDYTKSLDEIRNESITIVEPKLEKFINGKL